MNINITSKRLLLRQLQVEDITDNYIKALQDPSVIELTEARHTKWNRENVIQYVIDSNIPDESLLIGLFLKDEMKNIGNIRLSGFNKRHKRVELGIMIFDKSQWGKGYATESLNGVAEYVFKHLKYNKICADYYSINKGSEKIFKKAGYKIEGIFKNHFILNEKSIDSVRVAKFNNNISTNLSNKIEKKHELSRIPSIGPSITQKEIDAVTEAAIVGWHENMSLYIDRFIEKFSAFTGKSYCLPTSHGTSAIHLALMGLNIGPGDEVIVPDVTWVASASPIVYIGAKPVFVDIDPKNWCILPEAFEKAISEKTKAVMVVDLFGNIPEMDQILAIAKKHNIFVIEDAAEAIGAEFRKQPAGTFGDIGVFSFNGTKLVMAGQGGMLITDNKEIYERCKLLCHHGIDKSHDARYYWSNEIGYNYNWSNIQASLALAQLSRLDEFVNKRRKIFSWYKERLSDIEGLQLNFEASDVKNTYWITVGIVSNRYKMKKEMIQESFKAYNIDVRPFFYPLSSMPPFIKYCQGSDMKKNNPTTYSISEYGICFPSGHDLTEDNVDYVCKCFRKILLPKLSDSEREIC